MNIEIKINDEDIRREAQERAIKTAKQIAAHTIDEHFAKKGYCTNKNGYGTELIQRKIEEYLLSEETEKLIERTIAEIFEEKLIEATTYAAERAAKKAANIDKKISDVFDKNKNAP